MEIKEVTQQEATKIIDTREPIGLFYEKCERTGRYVGIDNLYGHANVEDFETKEECFRWLNRESELVNEKEIYMAALTKWGPKAQITMIFEEMAELQKELCKYLRGEKVIENIIEEIVDVEIMLGQMKELFDIEKGAGHRKEEKLRKLSELTKEIEVRICRKCGCKEYRACEGSCYWVEKDLCSKCVEPTFIEHARR